MIYERNVDLEGGLESGNLVRRVGGFESYEAALEPSSL